ncbi:MAG: ABC transporter substrate-binding protein [Candidatus Thermoplasmatota archaeon]|nr:ABC transporter substrate-binding protein [Candidatus Thermoplasmatota archaeon]MCL5253673.1 ABC transporter substrate-binding protein [Candidatus Thermoplasmatota archaeon]
MDEEIKRKPYAWIAVLIVVALVFFGIGYAVHTQPSKTTTATPSKVTVTFYESLATSESNFFQTVLIPQFEHEYPNITVDFVNLPSGQPPSEIQTLVQSNDVGTSLVGLDNLAVGEVIYSQGGPEIMNMGSIINNMLPSGLIPSALHMIQYEQNVFHATYFIPFRSNIPLVFYNKTALSSAGITAPPTTNSQLISDASAIYNKTGVKPVMFQGAGLTGGHTGASTATELYQWMVQYGGNPFVFNDTGDINAWDFLYNLSAYFNPQFTSGYWGSYSGLASGTYSVLDYQWPYVYGLLTNSTYKMTNSTLGVYPGTAGPVNGNHLLGGDVLVIPKGATNLPAIETLAKFLLSAQAQKETLLNLSWVAVNSAAYQNLPADFSQVGNALQQAISQGVFLRNPTPWITIWNAYASKAFYQIIVNHASFSQIPSILGSYNQEMYSYLQTNYNSTVASTYESGGYQPISV